MRENHSVPRIVAMAVDNQSSNLFAVILEDLFNKK